MSFFLTAYSIAAPTTGHFILNKNYAILDTSIIIELKKWK